MSQAEFIATVAQPRTSAADSGVAPLSAFRPGDRGVIIRVGGEEAAQSPIAKDELERRLLELGFVEGAEVTLLHEGLFGRDPIAVKLDDMRVALRRREAAQVFIRRTGT